MGHNGAVERRAKLLVGHFVGVLVIAAAAGYWWLRQADAPAAPTPAVPLAVPPEHSPDEPAPVTPPATGVARLPNPAPRNAGEDDAPTAPTAPTDVELPPLAESDAFVRDLLGADAPAAWRPWLQREGLVASATVILVNAGRGEVAGVRTLVSLPGAFQVQQAVDGLEIAPRSYARYDALLDVAVALPPELAAALFNRLAPLFALALAELGETGVEPLALLRATLGEVLRTPIPDGPVAVVRPGVRYEFADPRLQGLSALQKQLLRAGPANIAKAKRYARALDAAL